MSRQTIETYWAAVEARDWARFGATLAADVVYRLPQTRELVRGRESYVRFNAEYPGDWHVEIERLLAENDEAVSWTRFVVSGEEQTGLTFFRLDHTGAIAEITDFWPEPYTAPTGRAHLVERY